MKNTEPMKYVHEIKMEEPEKGKSDKFTKQFNLCSDLWRLSKDNTLSEDERKNYLDRFYQERMALETGNF